MKLNKIINDDCQNTLKTINSNSIDLIVTDPPYGLYYKCNDWDRSVANTNIWKECIRVLKPGSFAFIMSSPRQDLLIQNLHNLSEAGFKTNFTSIYWTYSSGLPKSYNIYKALENKQCKIDFENDNINQELKGSFSGFQPKPALDVVIVVMKPISEKSYIKQSLQNKKGITWLENCKIPIKIDESKELSCKYINENNCSDHFEMCLSQFLEIKRRGRYCSNLLVSDEVLNEKKTSYNGKKESKIVDNKCLLNVLLKTGTFSDLDNKNIGIKRNKEFYTLLKKLENSDSYSRYNDLDYWFEWKLKNLKINEFIPNNFPFIIAPKVSKNKRQIKCKNSNRQNDLNKINSNSVFNHPTVKPLKLMSFLITLGSCEGDVVLDPFAGSGTTCIAAKMLNRKFLGIEKNNEYYLIAKSRIKIAKKEIQK